MENAPPPYTPGEFGKGAPYPTNPAFSQNHPYCPPAGGAPYPPAQAGYPPTQPGYPPTQPGYPTQAPYPIVQAGYPVIQAPTQTVIVRSGSCPACGIGSVNKEVTCCGVCCALVFFPIGIICCIAMMESKCTNCHAKF